jgi:hypothetical protein
MDNNGESYTDQVNITGHPEPSLPNQQPVANAGNNLTITAPVDSIKLNGSSSFDPDGTLVYYGWIQLSGPSTASIMNSETAQPDVSGLITGIYTFQLMVTDNTGSTDHDQVTVTVQPGSNQIIQLPVPSGDSFTVFPNPVADWIHGKISSTMTGTIRMNIFDMNGRLVLTNQSDKLLNEFEKAIQVSALASGIYTIQVNIANRKTLVTKFVKL